MSMSDNRVYTSEQDPFTDLNIIIMSSIRVICVKDTS